MWLLPLSPPVAVRAIWLLPPLLLALSCQDGAAADWWPPLVLPEQTAIEVRDPSELAPAFVPEMPRPPTVADPQFDLPPRPLSLDEAIAVGLANSEVVRVLGGVTAVSSGRTIYDVAITNTTIDQRQALFDPTTRINNGWTRNESSFGIFDPLDPTNALLDGSRTDRHTLDFGLSRQTYTGGAIDLGVDTTRNRFRPGTFPLNPQIPSSVDLSVTQPLLQGGGLTVNQIPIVLARIETERSFFQYKDSVQRHVVGIINAYWSLVAARTDVWSRERQVEQADFIFERAERRLAIGDTDASDVAQAGVALQNFRVSLLNAQANVLQQEAALRNILGLPPYDPERVVPVTIPQQQKMHVDWNEVVRLAEQQRPDIVELKLILEADESLLRQSENQASPRVDATGLYRWNGLEGTVPNGMNLRSRPGQFTDWSVGVNFSVPLGLRRERAELRQTELLLARDRANLSQGIHQMVHDLAANLRNLDLLFEQYERFRAVREAARVNLDQQTASYSTGRVQFIVFLQAIVDWGNAVSSEAQSLTQYNTAVANLELATGTVLESHGVAFYEERFGTLGPLGRWGQDRCYPLALPVASAGERYIDGEVPSEESFNLSNPMEQRRQRQRERMDRLPPPLPEEPSPIPMDMLRRLPGVEVPSLERPQ